MTPLQKSCYIDRVTLDPTQLNPEVPADPIASIDEVREAIEAMTSAELLKLEKYARYRIRGLGRKAAGRDHEDLMKEAITATLAGNRRWKRENISFLTHLMGAVRSISSHWGEKSAESEAYLESELIRDSTNGKSYSPFQDFSSDTPNPDRVMAARQKLKQIQTRFEKDADILQILDGLSEGLSGPEIQTSYQFSKKKYEAALRRLRRGITALVE